jgi:hypothetical protein
MDRDSRRLSHNKGNKVAIINSPPLSSEGEDGDMKLETSGIGAILYVKGNGRWFKFRPSEFSLDGHHGSMKKIRILASDFQAANNIGMGEKVVHGTFAYVGFVNSETTNALTANVAIPIGFKATHVKIIGFASGTPVTDPTVSVYEGLFSKIGVGAALLNGGAMNVESPLAAGYQGHDDSYLQIYVNLMYGDSHASSHFIKGGYIKITPVLTPERVAEGMTSDDILDRSR